MSILCIAGPTASGKSALALAYAQQQAKQLPVEIIAVDSATIYRGMDIGTAKPPPSDVAICPHHLIDILDPSQSYSTGDFVRDATALIAQIQARGHQPVLVGGTMLYYKALLEGIDDLPAAAPAIRQDLLEQAKQLGWPALHAQLAQVDPASAARINPNDSQRVSRALEVYRSTGQPLSQFFKAKSHLPSIQHKDAPSTPFQLVALEPQDRSWLHKRIEKRFHQMLAQGLIDEVVALKARNGEPQKPHDGATATLHSAPHPVLQPDLPAMRCVGYRQVWAYLDGQCSKDEMIERGIAATRQLAKRQLTWLRSWPSKISLSCEALDDSPDHLERSTAMLAAISAPNSTSNHAV